MKHVHINFVFHIILKYFFLLHAYYIWHGVNQNVCNRKWNLWLNKGSTFATFLILEFQVMQLIYIKNGNLFI